jgi:hypothetical protein
VNSDNKDYISKDGVLFNKAFTELIAYPAKKKLSSYTVSDTITSIGYVAFFRCVSLSSINLPEGLTSIGRAFEECGSLRSISLPSTLSSVEYRAFRNCSSLSSVSLPEGLTGIEDEAFWRCGSLTSINFPSTLKSIGDWAFFECDNLTGINLPAGLTGIGDGAFAYCGSLTSVSLPASLTSIGYGAFSPCVSLASIDVNSDNKDYTSKDGVLFNKSFTELIAYPAGKKLSSYTVADTVTGIMDWAFYESGSLVSISLPDSLISIGEAAFYECNNLVSVSLYAQNPPTLGQSAFSSRPLYIYIPTDTLNAYKNASDWHVYRARLKPLP